MASVVGRCRFVATPMVARSLHEEPPDVVVGDLARIEGATTERLGGDHRVRRRTAAHAFRLEFAKAHEQFLQARFVDERHVTFVDSVTPQESVVDAVFHVDERIAECVDVVAAHR